MIRVYVLEEFFYIENFIWKVLRFIQYFTNPFCEKLLGKTSITFLLSKLFCYEKSIGTFGFWHPLRS